MCVYMKKLFDENCKVDFLNTCIFSNMLPSSCSDFAMISILFIKPLKTKIKKKL